MSALSDKVLDITLSYVGPASKTFLDRQCSAHLGVDFNSLDAASIPDLAKWVKISAGLLIGDAKAGDLANKILSLG